jgi:hypothetical protein
MTLLNPESLSWVDQLETLRALGPTANRTDCKKALNVKDSQITILNNLDDCFDPAAIEKIRQAAKSDPPYILSSGNAKALVGLKKKKISDLHGSVHAALDVIFARRLTTKQIEALVEWIISGKPASEFDPKTAKPPRKGIKKDKTEKETGSPQLGISSPSGTQQTLVSNLDLNKFDQLLQKAKAERVQGGGTTAQEKLEDYIRKIGSSLTGSKGSQSASTSDEVISETVLLDWIADIDVVKQLKAKRKKGKPLSGKEWGFLAVHKACELLGHLVKLILKLVKPLLKLLHRVWKLVVEALKVLGVYQYAKAIFTLVAVIAAIWFAWEAFHYGVMRPVEIVWSKIHLVQAASEPAPSASSSPDDKQSSVPDTSPKGVSSKKEMGARPIMAYKPSVSFKTTDFDPKLLEQEIAAIPSNSVIKDYVLQPDEGMPADLAVSRLQDLTDADKYTMMIGNGKQKIVSFTPNNTNFIITYKSADVFGVFGDGSGQSNFFWEDVKMILVDEIDVQSKTPSVIYQCSLIVSGSKNPLTIQCATAEDLENLVSAMEYFIRHSRVAHDAQPGGMPYPAQGLRLNNDGLVTALWSNSPMDKAGIGLCDMVWSLDKNTQEQQKRKDLETALQSLTPGQHTLYVVSPEDQVKAHIDENANHSGFFNPKRRKVSLPQ